MILLFWRMLHVSSHSRSLNSWMELTVWVFVKIQYTQTQRWLRSLRFSHIVALSILCGAVFSFFAWKNRSENAVWASERWANRIAVSFFVNRERDFRAMFAFVFPHKVCANELHAVVTASSACVSVLRTRFSKQRDCALYFVFVMMSVCCHWTRKNESFDWLSSRGGIPFELQSQIKWKH